jgi:uncharacterized membrane protein YphA (DoxX/SURF4 family)
MDPKLERIWMMLRIGLGTLAVVAGLDKFTNLLTYWPGYVAEPFAQLMPFSTQTFMYVVGVIEVAVGLAILTRFTRLGGYVMSAWLVCIAINLIAGRMYDIAARDVAIALGAFTLARLTEVVHGVVATRRERRYGHHRPVHVAT